MEEIVELHPSDFYPPESETLLLMDVGDIFDEMHRVIALNGEKPIHDVDGGNTDLFFMDIYNELGYLPFGPLHVNQYADNVLAACGSYFDATGFTGLQKELWRNAAQALASRMHAYGLYDHTHTNRYDYYRLQGDTLLLKRHN